jgi:hypothetical protein
MGLGLATAGAASANISRSYHFENAITNGSLVSLDPKRSEYVQPANISNGPRLIGVAVADGDSLIAVDTKAGTVQVATSGTANTLVSTLNGDIKVGDQIGVSPLNGVGMKALPGSHIIGLAQTAFNSTTDGATSQQVTDKQGKSNKIFLGYIRASVAVGNSNEGVASGVVLNDLQKLVQSLTGRSVSTPRIAISLSVAILAMIALVTLTYSAIYGSIISVGRNPLAKYAVFRTLASVLGMALLTTLVAALTVFFLLK